MRKKEFVPPVVKQTTLELEGAILGPSNNEDIPTVDTGHETFTYTPDTYWE